MPKRIVLFAVKALSNDVSLNRFASEEMADIKKIFLDGGKPSFPGLVSRARRRFGFNIFNEPIPPQYSEDYLLHQYTLLAVDAATGKILEIWEPRYIH